MGRHSLSTLTLIVSLMSSVCSAFAQQRQRQCNDGTISDCYLDERRLLDMKMINNVERQNKTIQSNNEYTDAKI